ncbi:MAG: hypothetical protein IJF83_08390 [Methanobrevibacter sp.]|nr:hypothetical protein [Methanobrevibacter sp.]MBR0371769.1 hypothetical protein [Methanobrevibacter sp.]
MLQCKICNQEFNSYTGLAGHINLKHHISSKEYYIKYLKQNDEGICPICGKETKWFSLRKGFRKHCSKSCSSADPNVYKIKTETEFKNTGYYNQMENPIHHKKMIELSKLKENQEKRIQSCKDNNGYGTGFQIKSVKEKAEKTIIDKYGVDNVFKLPEIHQIANKTKEEKYNNKNYNNREKAKETYYNKTGYYIPLQNPEVKSKVKKLYTFNNIKFDSSWELAYYIWLSDNNINFKYQPNMPLEYKVNNLIKYYYPDFLVNNQFYEIKGNQFFNENNQLINPFNNTLDIEKYQCMIDNNVKILREKDIIPILDYIEIKYGKSYLKQFKTN